MTPEIKWPAHVRAIQNAQMQKNTSSMPVGPVSRHIPSSSIAVPLQSGNAGLTKNLGG